MTNRLLFASRLRRARERRLTLQDLANHTKLSTALFESLEAGTCAGWPVGVYSRAHVRTYAELSGLDADETVKEFVDLFPHLAWSEQDKAPEVVAALRPSAIPASRSKMAVAPLRLVLDEDPEPFWRVLLTRLAWWLHRLANGGATYTEPARIQAPLAGEEDRAPLVPLTGLQVDQ